MALPGVFHAASRRFRDGFVPRSKAKAEEVITGALRLQGGGQLTTGPWKAGLTPSLFVWEKYRRARRRRAGSCPGGSGKRLGLDARAGGHAAHGHRARGVDEAVLRRELGRHEDLAALRLQITRRSERGDGAARERGRLAVGKRDAFRDRPAGLRLTAATPVPLSSAPMSAARRSIAACITPYGVENR